MSVSQHAITIICASLMLVACADNSEKNLQQAAAVSTDHTAVSTHDETQSANTEQGSDPHDVDALLKELKAADGTTQDADTPTATPITTADGKTQIDWSYIDTKTERVDAGSFAYPFAKDSQPVMNYAKAYNLSPEQAQYAMTLSMASPEALGKILDQLTGKYIAHSFRDGDKPALIIQVTPDVVNETHEYVIADKFAEGLVLPIEIVSAK